MWKRTYPCHETGSQPGRFFDRLPCVRGAVSRRLTEGSSQRSIGKRGPQMRRYDPSGASRHLPLRRGGYAALPKGFPAGGGGEAVAEGD